MIDLDAEREYIKKLGDDVRKICKESDDVQNFGYRICPRNIYQDATSKEICPFARTNKCRARFATCFKKYFAKKRADAAQTPPPADDKPQ